MGLLTFSLNLTLDGCVDHREGIADDRLELIAAQPLRCGAVALHYRRGR